MDIPQVHNKRNLYKNRWGMKRRGIGKTRTKEALEKDEN
jgi:hypothetical protein